MVREFDKQRLVVITFTQVIKKRSTLKWLKADKAASAFVGSAIVAGIVTYALCRLHDNWRIQQGEPDRCLLPAIEAGLQAGLERLFEPTPLPLQAGIDYVLERTDLYGPGLYGPQYFEAREWD